MGKMLLYFLTIALVLDRGFAEKPNFVVVLTDDQDVVLDGLVPMKQTMKHMEEGIGFENAYTTTPLCCPSRSSILTGLYIHNHGTVNNSLHGGCSSKSWQEKFEPRTFGALLHRAGYRTFYAGKYLNQYGRKSSGGPEHIPEGWDWWLGLLGNSVYYNYTLSVNGTPSFRGDTEKDYLTDVLKEYSLEFLKNPSQPFLMVVSTPSPHEPFTPALRHKGKFSGLKAPRTPNFNKAVKGTKHWLLTLPPEVLPPEIIENIDEYFRSRWESLLAVDEMVDAIMSSLKTGKVLDNTYIIYMSDNGFHLGQFALPWDKRQPYETDIKIPLMIRGPQIPKNRKSFHPALNIDLAPTIFDLAGVEPPHPMDGKSLFGAANDVPGKQPERYFLVEYVGEGGKSDAGCYNDPDVKLCTEASACKCFDSRNNTYDCLRLFSQGSNELYCEFKDGKRFKEFYNLIKDPYQMENSAGQNEKAGRYENILECCKRRISSGDSLDYCFPVRGEGNKGNLPGGLIASSMMNHGFKMENQIPGMKLQHRKPGIHCLSKEIGQNCWRHAQNPRHRQGDTSVAFESGCLIHLYKQPKCEAIIYLIGKGPQKKEKCDGNCIPVMEGMFPHNANLRINISTSSTRTICRVALIDKNENQLEDAKSGYSSAIISCGDGTIRVISREYLCDQDIDGIIILTLTARFFIISRLLANHISMLKRSLSMEFDSSQFKSLQQDPGNAGDSVIPESDNNNQSNKKLCHSPERSYEEDFDTRWSKPRKIDSYGRFQQNAENSHVTQSKSIFSHENSCIYGNPKEDIKNIDNPEAAKEVPLFDGASANALDLSCKSSKIEEEKPSESNTYQNYQKSNSCGENPRSNLQIKLVSPTVKKPSIPEQLQIAKIQQQQRRSIQQQQKLIQQMRRSLDPTGKNRSHHSNSTDQAAHKNVKYFGNNQEQNEIDYQGRMKEEYPQIPGSHFQQYPYFEPGQHKELPDGHPILPLLDPVYFSALYNSHGFLPPSSPSIAAAFIGTLQDALPKLPLVFPSTSSNASPILPQKSNETHN